MAGEIYLKSKTSKTHITQNTTSLILHKGRFVENDVFFFYFYLAVHLSIRTWGELLLNRDQNINININKVYVLYVHCVYATHHSLYLHPTDVTKALLIDQWFNQLSNEIYFYEKSTNLLLLF